MEFKIKELDIRNFKGIRSLRLDFHSGVNTLYGDNATGKTTVYDAFLWLLFDKDSQGSSKFNVKPIGVSGVTPEITAVLEVNGEELKLRKVLREKWEKPRGRSEAQYAGDTRDYYIDDVPRKENEYKRIISGYIEEEKFKLLTSIYAFARDMNWKDRRDTLAEVCGIPEDGEILAGAPQFKELADKLGRRTVDEYKVMLVSERKNANSTLNTLPIRIDECERGIEELSKLSFDSARREAAECEAEITRLRSELAQLDGDALFAKAQNEVRELEIDLRELENENRRYRDKQNIILIDPGKKLRAELSFNQSILQKEMGALRSTELQIENINRRLNQLRERYMSIKNEQESVEEICPMCGQPMPPEHIQQARERFEKDKQSRLDALVGDSTILKETLQTQSAARDEKQSEIAKLSQECEMLSRQIAETKPVSAPTINDMPDYQTRKTEFGEKVEAARRRVERIREDKLSERTRINDALEEQTGKKKLADTVLARRAQLENFNKRIEALHTEQRLAAAHLEELDRMINLCENYARYRVQFIEDRVNSRFRIARFRLFRQQVNGCLEDCCDVMVDGVPYSDLNNAARINVGLDIIETLSEHYGVSVPVFVDNAESVTRPQEIDSQVIRLAVNENDKELRLT